MNKSDQSYTVTPDTAATLRVDLTDAAAARGDVACASHIGLRHETNQDARSARYRRVRTSHCPCRR